MPGQKKKRKAHVGHERVRFVTFGDFMRRISRMVLAMFLAGVVGCAWLGRGKGGAPEPEYTDDPCQTECCCKVKKGYYVWYRCRDRAECDEVGGECLARNLARCVK